MAQARTKLTNSVQDCACQKVQKLESTAWLLIH